jgi:hypothetical protein
MKSKKMLLSLFLLIPAMIFIAGCDRDDHDHGHEDMERVNIIDRTQTARPVIATWTRANGWNTDVLYELSVSADENLTRVTFGVDVFNDHNEKLELCENCEFEARYWITEGAPQGIIDLSYDDDVLFHGDHVYVYGLTLGETQVEFILWHAGHADASTTPVTFRVVE